MLIGNIVLGIMEIPVETLDQIFYEYSIHGLNLITVKIQE